MSEKSDALSASAFDAIMQECLNRRMEEIAKQTNGRGLFAKIPRSEKPRVWVEPVSFPPSSVTVTTSYGPIAIKVDPTLKPGEFRLEQLSLEEFLGP